MLLGYWIFRLLSLLSLLSLLWVFRPLDFYRLYYFLFQTFGFMLLSIFWMLFYIMDFQHGCWLLSICKWRFHILFYYIISRRYHNFWYQNYLFIVIFYYVSQITCFSFGICLLYLSLTRKHVSTNVERF